MMPIPLKAPGGSRGTPGVNTIPRAMQIREKPNAPESPDSRPGLFGMELSGGINASGGSRGTPGLNAVQRAMQIREKPNAPESPDSRPGLLEIISTRQARRAVEAPACR